MGSKEIIFGLLFSLLLTKINCFLPGVSPNEYPQDAYFGLSCKELTSIHTQIPFPYDYAKLLPPIDQYIFHMNATERKTEFYTETLDKNQMRLLKDLINNEYRIHFIIDKLPILTKSKENMFGLGANTTSGFGVPIGYILGEHTYLITNIVFNIDIHDPNPYDNYKTFRIVGVSATLNDSIQLKEPIEKQEIKFSYGISFNYSKIIWASRWDSYQQISKDYLKIEWKSLLLSVLLVLVLAYFAYSLIKTNVIKDINRFNEEDDEMQLEEMGWKQLKGDVFKTPSNPIFLLVLTGTGVQLVAVIYLTLLCFAPLSFASPEYRGSIILFMEFFFFAVGILAGYMATRFSKMFQINHKLCIIPSLITFVIPAIILAVYLCLNTLLWLNDSSGVVPRKNIIIFLFLWVLCGFPLTTFGAILGIHSPPISIPVSPHQLTTKIQPQPVFLKSIIINIVGGFIPFSVVITELGSIMRSIWVSSFFYVMFYIVFLVMLNMAICCGLLSIVFTYIRLSFGDHKWWWKSFFSTSLSGVYVFLFSIWYSFLLDLKGMTAVILYFGYMAIISIICSLFTSTISFFASFLFIRKIFSLIKVD